MRHYSKVIIGVPHSPNDPPELRVRIDCDVCGVMQWTTHITHFGTLVRTLGDMYAKMADDGTSQDLGTRETLSEAVAYLDRAFPEWKVRRLKQRHGIE